MAKFECVFCRKGPLNGVSVHRLNAKGQPGIWACTKHMRNTDVTISPEVQQIEDALNRKKGSSHV